jgi:hypothetical protein
VYLTDDGFLKAETCSKVLLETTNITTVTLLRLSIKEIHNTRQDAFTGKKSVSVLVEDMPRNNFLFPGSNIRCFTFYIHL